MSDKLTTELLKSIAADPIISFYLEKLNSANRGNDKETPKFNEKTLRLALKVVRGPQATNSRRYDIKTFRLYKRLLLYYYAGRYKSLSERNALKHCFGKEDIAAAFSSVNETIIHWHNYIKNNLLHLLLKETFMETMLEWVRRYHYLYGSIDEGVCKYNAASVMTLLFCNLTYLEDWCPELEHLVAKMNLTQSNESYASLSFHNLSVQQIIHDIQQRFSPLVHKFVLNSLQLENGETLRTVQQKHLTKATSTKASTTATVAQEPNDSTGETKPITTNSKAQVSDAEHNAVLECMDANAAEPNATTCCPARKHRSSFQYYSDFSRIQYMPQELRLNILHAANQTKNIAMVGKRYNITSEKVSLIIRFRQEILNEWKYNPDPAKRLSHLEIEHLVAINDVIKEWYWRAVHVNASLTDEQITEKAQELKCLFKLEEFEVSSRWLKKFKTHLEIMKNNGCGIKTSLDIKAIVEDLKWVLPAPGYALFKRHLTTPTNEESDVPAADATAKTTEKSTKPQTNRRNKRTQKSHNEGLSKAQLENFSRRNVTIKKFFKKDTSPTLSSQLTTHIKTYGRKRGSTVQKTLDVNVVDNAKQELIEVMDTAITVQSEQTASELMTHDELLELFTAPLAAEDDTTAMETADNCNINAINTLLDAKTNEDEYIEAFELIATDAEVKMEESDEGSSHSKTQSTNLAGEVVVKEESSCESQRGSAMNVLLTNETNVITEASNEEDECGAAVRGQLLKIKTEFQAVEDNNSCDITPSSVDFATQIEVKNEPIDLLEECTIENDKWSRPDNTANSARKRSTTAVTTMAESHKIAVKNEPIDLLEECTIEDNKSSRPDHTANSARKRSTTAVTTTSEGHKMAVKNKPIDLLEECTIEDNKRSRPDNTANSARKRSTTAVTTTGEGHKMAVKNKPIDLLEKCTIEDNKRSRPDNTANSARKRSTIAVTTTVESDKKEENDTAAAGMSFENYQLKVMQTLANMRAEYRFKHGKKPICRTRKPVKTYSKSVCIDLPHTSNERDASADDDKHQIDLSKLLTAADAKLDSVSEELLQLQKTLETATNRRRHQETSKRNTAAKIALNPRVFTVIPCATNNTKTSTAPARNSINEKLKIKIEKPDTEPQIKLEPADESNVGLLQLDCSTIKTVDVKLEELSVECNNVVPQPAHFSTFIRSTQDAYEYLDKLERFTWRMKNKDALMLLRQLKQCFQDDIKWS